MMSSAVSSSDEVVSTMGRWSPRGRSEREHCVGRGLLSAKRESDEHRFVVSSPRPPGAGLSCAD